MRIFTVGRRIDIITESIYGRTNVIYDGEFFVFHILIKYNPVNLAVKGFIEDEVMGEYAKLDKLFK